MKPSSKQFGATLQRAQGHFDGPARNRAQSQEKKSSCEFLRFFFGWFNGCARLLVLDPTPLMKGDIRMLPPQC